MDTDEDRDTDIDVDLVIPTLSIGDRVASASAARRPGKLRASNSRAPLLQKRSEKGARPLTSWEGVGNTTRRGSSSSAAKCRCSRPSRAFTLRRDWERSSRSLQGPELLRFPPSPLASCSSRISLLRLGLVQLLLRLLEAAEMHQAHTSKLRVRGTRPPCYKKPTRRTFRDAAVDCSFGAVLG